MGALENQCLVPNRSWQAVNVITVQAALSMMAADAATGMNFTEGSFVPVKWSPAAMFARRGFIIAVKFQQGARQPRSMRPIHAVPAIGYEIKFDGSRTLALRGRFGNRLASFSKSRRYQSLELPRSSESNPHTRNLSTGDGSFSRPMRLFCLLCGSVWSS
jgi:hypothetical protein